MNKRLRDKEAWIVQAKREREYEKEHPELIEEKVAELKEIRKQKDMTRAEQAALKAYPKSEGIRELKGISARPIFIQGYEKAENDTREELLEWAKEKADFYKQTANIRRSFEMVIDKLNSM